MVFKLASTIFPFMIQMTIRSIPKSIQPCFSKIQISPKIQLFCLFYLFHMKIDTFSFNFIYYSASHSFSTIYGDFSKLPICCCSTQFITKSFLFSFLIFSPISYMGRFSIQLNIYPIKFSTIWQYSPSTLFRWTLGMLTVIGGSRT